MTLLRSTIISQIEQLGKEREKALPPLADDLQLIDSGLDSLELAIVVARLEDALGFDPFAASQDVYFPVTVGDFVRFYEAGLKGDEATCRNSGHGECNERDPV